MKMIHVVEVDGKPSNGCGNAGIPDAGQVSIHQSHYFS